MENSLKDKIFIELSKWNRGKNIPQVSYQTKPQKNGNTIIEVFGYEMYSKTNPMLKEIPVIILTPTDIGSYKIQTIKRTYYKYGEVIQNVEEAEMESENVSEFEINGEKIKSFFKKIENLNKSWQRL